MHVWLDLISRELLLVALLAAIGSGPAAFLSERFDGVARLALAPVLGLCVGVCLTVTLVYFVPTADTGWVLIPLAVLSLALAARRTRGLARWTGGRGILALAVVAVVILGSFDYALAVRHTVGPDGGYTIADTAGYVSEIDGEVHASIRDADRLYAPFADLGLSYWAGYAQSNQQLDVSALESNVNELIGVGATDTQSPFLIAVLLIGALGVFAVVLAVGRQPVWAALAGCIFAGPLFAELFMDGSEAAIAGCAVLAPLAALGWEALRCRRPATLVLFALLVAGLQTLYPLFVPPVVVAAVAVLAVKVIRRVLRGLPARSEVLAATWQLAMVVALACAFTPVAFLRNARYWISILNGSFSTAGLPAYVLPINVLPGWVLQTREFYNLPNLASATRGPAAGGRNRAAHPDRGDRVRGPASPRGADDGRDCRRSHAPGVLHVVEPELRILRAAQPDPGRRTGRAGDRPRPRCDRDAAHAGPHPARGGDRADRDPRHRPRGDRRAPAAGQRLVSARQPGSRGDFGPSGAIGSGRSGRVRAGPGAPDGAADGLQPGRRAGVRSGVGRDRPRRQPRSAVPGWDTAARAVVQPGLPLRAHAAGRRIDGAARRARDGPIALEERTRRSDVTVTGGVPVPSPDSIRVARPGSTRTGPCTFLSAATRPGPEAWISVELDATVPVKVKGEAGTTSVRNGRILRICLTAVGSSPVREAGVELGFVPQPAPSPGESHAPALPPRGVRLTSISVSATRCSLS